MMDLGESEDPSPANLAERLLKEARSDRARVLNRARRAHDLTGERVSLERLCETDPEVRDLAVRSSLLFAYGRLLQGRDGESRRRFASEEVGRP